MYISRYFILPSTSFLCRPKHWGPHYDNSMKINRFPFLVIVYIYDALNVENGFSTKYPDTV